MSETPANTRPKNPDGTVNWRVVFDDPNRGILQAVDKTTSIKQLAGLITQIAPLLYQRKNDAAVREEFVIKMNALIAGENELGFDETKGIIRRALEAEQAHRIEEAKKYIENKRSGQSIERRRSNWSFSIGGTFFGTKRRMFSTIGVIAILIIGIVVMQLDIDKLMTPPPGETETAESVEKPPEPEPTAPKKPVVKPAPEPKKKDQTYPVFLMKPLTFLFGKARLSLVPVIVAPAYENRYDDKDTICRLVPRIAEAINFAIGAKAREGQSVSAGELANIASQVRSDMDRYLGDDKIKKLYLVDTRKFDQDALRAAYGGCGMFNLSTDPNDLRK